MEEKKELPSEEMPDNNKTEENSKHTEQPPELINSNQTHSDSKTSETDELNDKFRQELEKQNFVHKKNTEDSTFISGRNLDRKNSLEFMKRLKNKTINTQTIVINTIKKPLVIIGFVKSLIIPKKQGNTIAGLKDRFKSLIKFLFILSVVFIEICVIYLAYNVYVFYKNPPYDIGYLKDYQNYSQEQLNKIRESALSKDKSINKNLNYIQNQNSQDPPANIISNINGYEIYKKEGFIQKSLITLSRYERDLILRAYDDIFYPKESGSIYKLNVNSLQESLVFNLENFYTKPNNIYTRPQLTDIQLIDNTIFLSFGGFSLEPGTYWLDPITLQSGKIANSRNGTFAQLKDTNWIIGGEGDGGIGILDLIYFDPITKKVVKDYEFSSYFGIGSYPLELNHEEGYFLIIESREGGFSDDDNLIPFEVYDYLGIYEFPDFEKTILIDFSKQIDQNVTDIFYIKEQKLLFIAGTSSLYKYSIKDKEIVKIADYPQELIFPLVSINGSQGCIKDLDLDLEFIVDLDDNIINQVSYCSLGRSLLNQQNLFDQIKKADFAQIYNELGLPEEFGYNELK